MRCHHVLNADARMVAVRLELNDVPLWNRPGGGSDHLSAGINPWILPGLNSLRIGVDWPEGVSYQARAARLDVVLAAKPVHSDLATPHVLMRAEWPDGKAEAYPAGELRTFTIAEAPPSRLWQSAPVVELTPVVHREIRELIAGVQDALAARNVDRVTQWFDFRTIDIAEATYSSVADARRGQREAFEQLLGDAANHVEPLYLDTIELHPVASGRVIWVTRADRAPLFRFPGPDGVQSIQAYVARIDGAWTIVR